MSLVGIFSHENGYAATALDGYVPYLGKALPGASLEVCAFPHSPSIGEASRTDVESAGGPTVPSGRPRFLLTTLLRISSDLRQGLFELAQNVSPDLSVAHPSRLLSLTRHPPSWMPNLPCFFLRIREMYTAEQTLEHIHPRLRALVSHYKAKTGCSVRALKKVASKIGTSEHWIRRVLGRYGEASVQAHLFLNIIREHVRVKRAESRKIGRFWPVKAGRILRGENSTVAG